MLASIASFIAAATPPSAVPTPPASEWIPGVANGLTIAGICVLVATVVAVILLRRSKAGSRRG